MRLKSGAGHAVPTIMKMALSFSIAASSPGLDLYQTSTFSEQRREPTEFQSRKGISEIEGKAARVAAMEFQSRNAGTFFHDLKHPVFQRTSDTAGAILFWMRPKVKRKN